MVFDPGSAWGSTRVNKFENTLFSLAGVGSDSGSTTVVSAYHNDIYCTVLFCVLDVMLPFHRYSAVACGFFFVALGLIGCLAAALPHLPFLGVPCLRLLSQR